MKPIHVTEPFLPPLKEYITHLNGIWERNWLTNQGPLVQELERKLREYHDLSTPVHCIANGALGLQIALKALGVKGEVVTTPFSYVATTACPLWEGCPVKFADIEPEHLTIDPAAAEAAITPRTEAIVATHVFGNPCDVEALEAIAAKHNLAIIYDAAHAFGVRYQGRSLLEWGDVSMVSLHATKLFHTVEGGFVVAKDPATAEVLEWMRRFAHKGQEDFHGVGINAKMSELHAAMGLAIFPHLPEILRRRRELIGFYDAALAQGHRSARRALRLRPETEWNWSYYPVLCESEATLLELVGQLSAKQIFPRRYFYPALHEVPAIHPGALPGDCPIASDIARRIVCLPLAASFDESDLDRIFT